MLIEAPCVPKTIAANEKYRVPPSCARPRCPLLGFRMTSSSHPESSRSSCPCLQPFGGRECSLARFAALKSSSYMASVRLAPPDYGLCVVETRKHILLCFPDRVSHGCKASFQPSLDPFSRLWVEIRRIMLNLGFGCSRLSHSSRAFTCGTRFAPELSFTLKSFLALTSPARISSAGNSACWKSHPLTLLSRINKDVLSIGCLSDHSPLLHTALMAPSHRTNDSLLVGSE